MGELAGPVDHLAGLLVELVDTGEAAAADGLIGAGDQADETGLVVQRLQHRHRRHRGAVRVGDDALASVGDLARVDLADDQRHVGIHPPRRRVVDHDGAGGGEPRRQLTRRRRARREQGDVETGGIGGRRVLDGDLRCPSTAKVVPAERAEAKKRISTTGKLRSARIWRMTAPTWPVAPTTPIFMAAKANAAPSPADGAIALSCRSARRSPTSHQWLRVHAFERLVDVPAMPKLRRFGDRTICTSVQPSAHGGHHLASATGGWPASRDARSSAGWASAGPEPGHAPQRPHHLAGRPQHRVAGGPRAEVERDVAARPGDPHGLARQAPARRRGGSAASVM